MAKSGTMAKQRVEYWNGNMALFPYWFDHVTKGQSPNIKEIVAEVYRSEVHNAGEDEFTRYEAKSGIKAKRFSDWLDRVTKNLRPECKDALVYAYQDLVTKYQVKSGRMAKRTVVYWNDDMAWFPGWLDHMTKGQSPEFKEAIKDVYLDLVYNPAQAVSTSSWVTSGRMAELFSDWLDRVTKDLQPECKEALVCSYRDLMIRAEDASTKYQGESQRKGAVRSDAVKARKVKPSQASTAPKEPSNVPEDKLGGKQVMKKIEHKDDMRKRLQDPQRPIGLQMGSRSVVKIGPWGGTGGTPRDIRIYNKPRYLETITVRSTDSYGGRINGFFFVYNDSRGQSIPVGFWGSNAKGYEDTITMGSGEFVNYMSGTADETGVRSLTFGTNKGVQRTYGYPQLGTPFSVPLQQEGGELLGFFGRAEACLVALGAYVAVGNV
ncbi:hypothetical protein EJB05_49536 [Eragrostis curvula]|uniref:Jacalin-type lectin domain-containing protein n=1 Tax=Eragrostis curvula TaxID=38414 RepID=A0A5J9T515_9POAL|nr:hypothetical protein EJB05_49536 [Eragrostis curvula]